VEVQNVDDMKKIMYLEVTYTSEIGAEISKEDKEERKKVIEYLRDLIESDFHETYKLKIKQYQYFPHYPI
jgi:hypothetical protein